MLKRTIATMLSLALVIMFTAAPPAAWGKGMKDTPKGAELKMALRDL